MIPLTEVKDTLGVVVDAATLIAGSGGFLAWYVTRRDRKLRGDKALDQIDKMSTNCFPTMQSQLVNQTGILTEMRDVLKDINKGTITLVARSGYYPPRSNAAPEESPEV